MQLEMGKNNNAMYGTWFETGSSNHQNQLCVLIPVQPLTFLCYLGSILLIPLNQIIELH